MVACRVSHSHTVDVALIVLEHHEVTVSPFLQIIEVTLNGNIHICYINSGWYVLQIS